MPEAIFFDLDDTIIAWDEVSGEYWRKACDRFTGQIKDCEPGQIVSAITEVRTWYWSDLDRHREGRLDLFSVRREIVRLAFEKLGINEPGIAEQLADAYSIEREEAAMLIPGALDTLRHFKDNDVKLAMITNGSSTLQRAKIERFRLARFFDYILVEGEFGKGKPEPEVFINALEELDVKVADTWMVGDDLARDIGGASQAGIYSVWVDWRSNGLPESSEIVPDRIVKTISELKNPD